MRKQLHSTLKLLTSERGAWNEGPKEVYWMLSNLENRQKMRCKLVENLKFDSHFEASRLRDYSGYSNSYICSTTNNVSSSSNTNTKVEDIESVSTLTNDKDPSNLAQKLQLNKEAINTQIKEDIIADEEFGPMQSNQAQSSSQSSQAQAQTSNSLSTSQADSNISRSSSVSSFATTTTTTSNSAANNSASSQTPARARLVSQEHYDAQTPHLEEKEKLIIRSECELITVTRVIKGRFELTNKYIYFFDTFSSFYFEQETNKQINDFTDDYSNTFYLENRSSVSHAPNNDPTYINTNDSNLISSTFSSNSLAGFSCNDFDILNDFKIPLSQLKEVQLRRYNLRRSALEFFLINESNFFINFNKNVRTFYSHMNYL